MTQEVVGSGVTSYVYDGALLARITDGMNHRDTLKYDTKGNLREHDMAVWRPMTSYQISMIVESPAASTRSRK